MSLLKITQVRSLNGAMEKHRATVRTLGLRKIGQTVYHNDTPQIRGMVESVRYIVSCESVNEKPKAQPKAEAGYKVIKAKK
ncbi:50S ribosomal protein L30 [bacterium]|nr:50S ribosomal protein L30 [bacterium]